MIASTLHKALCRENDQQTKRIGDIERRVTDRYSEVPAGLLDAIQHRIHFRLTATH